MTGEPGPTSRPPDDEAAFAAARIGSRRGSGPLVAAVWVVALGGAVAVGAAGRFGPEADVGSHAVTTEAPRASAVSLAAAPSRPIEPGRATARPIASHRTISSGQGPVSLDVVRTSASVFVHGDIYAEQVVWVFVSVQDDLGDVAGWASLSFPSSIGEPGASDPALRFDVELVIPDDMLDGRLWAQANVYDDFGQRVGTTRLEIPGPDDHASVRSLERLLNRGFRPTGLRWNREMAGDG